MSDTYEPGARVEVVLPEMGESVTEGTVTKWLVEVGETVELDQPLVEVATDKVDAEIPSPVAGTVVEILRAEGDVVQVEEILVIVTAGESGDAAAPRGEDRPPTETPAPE